MNIEITIPSRSAVIVAGILREILAKGNAIADDEAHDIEAVINALDEADRIVIQSDDFLSQEE